MAQTQQPVYMGGNVIEPSAACNVMKDLKDGRVPTNQDLVEALRELEKGLKSESAFKKGTESRFANDAQMLIQHARELMEEKNSDDTLRLTVSHLKEASDLLSDSVSKEKIAGLGEAWQRQGSGNLQHVIGGFKNLVVSLARNPSFRVGVIEGIQLLQEAFSEAISAALMTEENVDINTLQCSSSEYMKKEYEKIITQSFHSSSSSSSSSSFQGRENLRKILIELGKNTEYKEFINSLSIFFEINWTYLETLFDEATTETKTLTALLVVISDVQVLLERFSGNKSLHKLRLKLRNLLLTISGDQQIRDFFGKWRDFLKKTIEYPEAQDVDSLDRELQDLLDTGKDILNRKRIQQDFEIVLRESRELIERLREDSSMKTFGDDLKNLKKDLLYNNDGKLDILMLKNSIPTLKNVLIPSFTSTLRNIPIPTVNIDNEKYSFQISNLSLAAKDLIPEKIQIHFVNDIYFDFSADENDVFITKLTVATRELSGILRDINFKYDRKKMPHISDFGVADVEINGMDIDIRWKMELKDSNTLSFFVDHIQCTIETLNTNVKEAHHKMLDNIYLKLFNRGVKSTLEKGVEAALLQKLFEFTIDTSVPYVDKLPLEL